MHSWLVNIGVIMISFLSILPSIQQMDKCGLDAWMTPVQGLHKQIANRITNN